MKRSDFWDVAHELKSSGVSFAVVTLITIRGHAPQDEGAKMIITPQGRHWGTVGGGKVESQAIEHARTLVAKKVMDPQPQLLIWNLQRDVGMTCGGEVTFLFEVFHEDALKIVIFGAGHVGQALVRALEPIECHVTCIDPREDWIARLPQSSAKLKAIHVTEPMDQLAQYEKHGSLDENSFFYVMTQGHATDLPVAAALMHKYPDAPYFGVIGSQVKALKLRSDLKERGLSDEAIARFHCPLGLPFGTNRPGEIAISIIAELLQIRDKLSQPN